jgi:hypothetical protein
MLIRLARNKINNSLPEKEPAIRLPRFIPAKYRFLIKKHHIISPTNPTLGLYSREDVDLLMEAWTFPDKNWPIKDWAHTIRRSIERVKNEEAQWPIQTPRGRPKGFIPFKKISSLTQEQLDWLVKHNVVVCRRNYYGTFYLHADVDRVEEYLPMPRRDFYRKKWATQIHERIRAEVPVTQNKRKYKLSKSMLARMERRYEREQEKKKKIEALVEKKLRNAGLGALI